MKVTETYNQGCSQCGATGMVNYYLSGLGVDSTYTNVCPVCKGSGVVLVTREYETSQIFDSKQYDSDNNLPDIDFRRDIANELTRDER